MESSINDEKWLEVKFDFEFTNEMIFEVSNFGRVRSFNKIHNGKILKGAHLNGYNTFALKFFKPKTTTTQKRFDF